MADPLAEFRRKGSGPAAPERSNTKGREPYEAFQPKDRARALDILCKDGSGHSATYNFLLYVSWDRRAHDSFMLVYGSLMVKVRGRNLREVIQALRLRKCEFLCEYNEEEFEPPAADVPVITSIEVVKAPAVSAFMSGMPQAT